LGSSIERGKILNITVFIVRVVGVQYGEEMILNVIVLIVRA